MALALALVSLVFCQVSVTWLKTDEGHCRLHSVLFVTTFCVLRCCTLAIMYDLMLKHKVMSCALQHLPPKTARLHNHREEVGGFRCCLTTPCPAAT